MTVANDVTSLVDLLGSRIVVGISVDEIAGLKVINRNRHIESGVGSGNVLTVNGIYELG